MKPLSYGSEPLHRARIHIADVQRRGFSLIDQKCRNDGGLNLEKFGIFRDIYTALRLWHFGMKPLF